MPALLMSPWRVGAWVRTWLAAEVTLPKDVWSIRRRETRALAWVDLMCSIAAVPLVEERAQR